MKNGRKLILNRQKFDGSVRRVLAPINLLKVARTKLDDIDDGKVYLLGDWELEMTTFGEEDYLSFSLSDDAGNRIG